MHKHVHKNMFRLTRRIAIALTLLLATVVAWADGNAGEKKERWQIEMFAGFTWINPADLNQLAVYENSVQTFFYDTHLDYLKNIGAISNWTKTNSTQQTQIQNARPFGGRISYSLSTALAVSIGFEYMRQQASSSFDVTYSHPSWWSTRRSDDELISYAPFLLSTTAFTPSLGIQWRKPLTNRIEADLFFNAGLAFATCHFNSNWNYTWNENFTYNGTTKTTLMLADSRNVTMDGSGTGLALELGGRVNYRLLGPLGMFAAASYNYQRVKNISGAGSEVLPHSTNQWNGTWGMKNETMTTLWGTLEIEVPNSNWPADKTWVKTRDFILDLSAFQAYVGLYVRL